VPGTITEIERQERESVAALCDRARIRFVRVSDADRAALRHALAPVRTAHDPETGRYVATIERIRHRLDCW
jgi:hypothetical protein